MNKIRIKQINSFHMEAVNEDGNSVSIDAASQIGGTGKGMRPMQVLLSALGGCCYIDVLSILGKQKQFVKNIHLTLEGAREKKKTGANIYKTIHIHFEMKGDLDASKVERAIDLSLNKYCSVAMSLSEKTTITYSFEIV
ncbi:MAG: OsmC family protein [Cyclobacteriaceae bacterium]